MKMLHYTLNTFHKISLWEEIWASVTKYSSQPRRTEAHCQLHWQGLTAKKDKAMMNYGNDEAMEGGK